MNASAVSLCETNLCAPETAGRWPDSPSFFISYARTRPEEADFVETLLRRRGYTVFRDEHDFALGAPLSNQITEYIYLADVFVGLHCREYVSSPWCFDELDLALNRREGGRLALWLLRVDETLVVHPRARSLTHHLAPSREELESRILALLETLETAQTGLGSQRCDSPPPRLRPYVES